MKTFKEQFIEARRASGLSQEQVAEKLNLSRSAVSHWETGRTLPDAEILKQLSVLLNYNFVDFKAAPVEAAASGDADEMTVESEAPLEALPDADAALMPEETTPAAPQKSGKLLYLAIGAVIGLIVGLLLGVYAIPHAAPAVKPVYLEIGSDENPVMAINDEECGVIWYFDVKIRNKSESTFTIAEVVQKVIPENQGHIDTFRYTPDDLRWDDGVLTGGAEKSFSAGMPVQAIKEVRIEVSGLDQWGTPLTFEGVIELSKEMKE